MQAVLDREVLEVAQPRIDTAQGLVGRLGAVDARLARQSAALRGLDDQFRQTLAAAAIESVGLRVFVDQALELARVAGKSIGGKSGGGRWPIVTAAIRRLACAASPGLLTMNG